MNFLESLLQLLFGGGKKPSPKPPAPRLQPVPTPPPARTPPPEIIAAPKAPEPMARVEQVDEVAPRRFEDPAWIPPPPELRGVPADPNFKLKSLTPTETAAKFVPCAWNGAMPADRTIGPYQWRDPQPDEPAYKADYRNIVLVTRWEQDNIERFALPELTERLPQYKSVRFHKAGKEQLKALWAAWKAAGLLGKIESWEGAFNPRYMDFNKSKPYPQRSLSNHAFGTAFDINAQWNLRDTVPAAAGSKGSVHELVPLAHKYGFYWGGNFRTQDGMHFELREILEPAELAMRRKFPIDPLA